MSYKDCIVTTIEYTVAGDEEFSDTSVKQEVYDAEGNSNVSDALNVTPDGILAMLEETQFWAEDSYEFLDPVQGGTQVKIVFWHPNTEEEGTIQVTTTRGGKANINPPQRMSTENIEDILNGMWYADQ